MHRVLAGAAVCCAWSFGFAQQPAFEVASVKHLTPDSGQPGSNLMRGGPGTADPGRISFAGATLKRLLMAAYGVEVDQIAGPGWLDSERYSVDAKVPPGTTGAQLKAMLQNLLVEQFELRLHRETKSAIGYELTVSKRGQKLSPWNPNGPPEPPPGRYTTARTESGTARLTFHAFTMPGLANVLGMPLGGLAGNRVAAATVVDKTGLTGKYDFTLEFAGVMGPGGAFSVSGPDSPPPAAANLFDALETQLGLRLVEHKVPREVLVIDAVNKVPLEN